MANIDAPFGLKPINLQGGVCLTGAVNAYYVPSGDSTALFIGDPVVRTSDGANASALRGGEFPAGRLPEVTKATAGDGNAITGVVVGFLAIDPESDDPIYRPASTEGIVLVADDPKQVFEIQADGAIAATEIGLNANLIFTNAGDANTGLSGVELDTTSDAPAADQSNQLRILRVSNVSGRNEVGSANTVVEVMINQHTEINNVLGI